MTQGPPSDGPRSSKPAFGAPGASKPGFGPAKRPATPAPKPTPAPPPASKPTPHPLDRLKKKAPGAGIQLQDLPVRKLVVGVTSTLGVIGVVVLVVTLGRSCQRPQSQANLTPPPSNLAPDASVAPDSSRASEDLWQHALEANEDPIELSRLAESEGATGLLDALEEGGAVGLVALAALPFADDAELAMARLAEISRQVDDAGLGPVLDAIEGVSQQPLRQREHYDPTGIHAAFDAMVELSKREKLAKPLRARAVSVGRLIASRGPYDAALLPRDLDAQ